MARDPLADQPPCPCGNPHCPCGRCHGDGWVEVQPGYARELFPDPTLDKLAQLDDTARERLWAHLEVMRAAAERSVYPCKACRPVQFYRWAGGHLAPGHDPTNCSECLEALGVKGAKSAARGRTTIPTPPPRKDTDE
jgi:hypothetical protein